MDDKKRITFRRLLLAKELYPHGLGHSSSNSSLDRMIAVHNFHNALEIALRAIFLEYEIPAEKHLNIDFESMLNEIDSFQQFKDKKMKLPYRQELRNLNQLRNMVQHHAVVPESSTIDEWKVFARRFLIKIYDIYFKIPFQEVSSVGFISNEHLRHLLFLAYEAVEKEKPLQAIIAAQLAFIFSSYSVKNFLPDSDFNNSFFAMSDIRPKLRDLPRELSYSIESTIKKIYDKIEESILYSLYVSTSVSFVDYSRYK